MAHSRSPEIHNAWFRSRGVAAKYIKAAVSPENLGTFMCRFSGKFSGANITIPHKESIIPYLDGLSPEARAIGAVNTIVVKKGKLFGHNTDVSGALEALRRGGMKSLHGRRIAVIGAGGAARAIVYGLARKGARITIFNRTLTRARRLAREFHVTSAPLRALSKAKFDVLINASALGMNGKGKAPAVHFLPSHIVMDIVYTPRLTPLLKGAIKAGCKIITGEKMLIEQARKSFALWTGRPAPKGIAL